MNLITIVDQERKPIANFNIDDRHVMADGKPLFRGSEYTSDRIAVRAMAHKHVPYGTSQDDSRYRTRWDFTMPRSDSRFGVLNPFGGRSHSVDNPDLPDSAPDGTVKWVPLEWKVRGVFIGMVYKYEGKIEPTDYDGGGGGFDYGAKKIKLACLSLRGTNDGFVLAYAYPKDLK